MKRVRKYKFQLIFFALIALVLAPLTSMLIGIPHTIISLISFTLIVFAGFAIAELKIPKLLTIILGSLTLISVWIEFFVPTRIEISYFRMIASFILFIILTFILIRNCIDSKKIDVSIIFGAMAGFVLLGLIGGVAFEILEDARPGSVLFASRISDYDFYYFSFISLMTVGYGDIVPLSAAAKSLSVLINIAGQFYMTIGFALFVGKYLHHSNSK